MLNKEIIAHLVFQTEQAKWLNLDPKQDPKRLMFSIIKFWYFNVIMKQSSFPIDLGQVDCFIFYMSCRFESISINIQLVRLLTSYMVNHIFFGLFLILIHYILLSLVKK